MLTLINLIICFSGLIAVIFLVQYANKLEKAAKTKEQLDFNQAFLQLTEDQELKENK